ncbi:YnjH family protein [Aeromonas rivipollensis]|uniref:YnjH family protein n=1 Tax=Aeromonas rivipollensis TaxID=948519 RepID=UPI003D1C9C15
MIRTAFCLFALGGLLPAEAAHESNTLSHSVGTDLVLPLGSLPERVCWYQDQKYSLGSRIQQGDLWLECGPQNEQESNGPLAWREPAIYEPVDEGAVNRETIRVGQ